MGNNELPESLCEELSEFIAGKMGLNFPAERWADLRRGLAGAAGELKLDPGACAKQLLSPGVTKAQLQMLARHLTIGETYFFREKKTLEVLVESVLPKLVDARRKRERRLRIWSAACCTGEEAYSLAILLEQTIPDLADWQVSILATDINDLFLQKAAAGVYGEWSFRDAPEGLKERYFQKTPKGLYAILPEIKKRVTFANLNLVEDAFPSLATDTNAMDVIFCRNVLMYFTAAQARKVVGNLRRALVEDGWLAVSPSESSQVLFSGFATENFPGVILYRKGEAKAAPAWPPAVVEPMPTFTPPPPPAPKVNISPEISRPAKPARSARAEAAASFAQGRYGEAAETLVAALGPAATAAPEDFSLLARALANQGKLAEAREWCERWIAADKLDPSAHYLRAIVLQEMGDAEGARRALQRSIYVDQSFVLGYFALGNLAREGGRTAEAARHFENALQLLSQCAPEALLPESDGLTAGRLTEIISSIAALAATP